MENKETIEEVAERLCNFSLSERVGFYKCFDWQQERSYSEEDMKQFAYNCVAGFLSNEESKLEMELVEIIMDRNNKKFKQWLDTNPRLQIREVQLEVIAEEFAIGFGEYLLKNYDGVKSVTERLEIYKKENQL